ncbi:MFS transporter [Cupriavidus basilensis]
MDWLGALLLAVAIVAFLLAMSWGGDVFDWISPQLGLLALLTVAAVAALAWQERRAADPMLPPRLFANRAYVMGVAASALAALNIFLCIFALPLHFQLVRGADASMSGLLVVPFLLATVAGNFIVAWLAPRVGRMRGILTAGFIAGVLGLAVLALATPDVPLAVVLLAMAVGGTGLGMAMVGTLMSVQDVLERRDTGTGTGALLVLRSLGSALGGALRRYAADAGVPSRRGHRRCHAGAGPRRAAAWQRTGTALAGGAADAFGRRRIGLPVDLCRGRRRRARGAWHRARHAGRGAARQRHGARRHAGHGLSQSAGGKAGIGVDYRVPDTASRPLWRQGDIA